MARNTRSPRCPRLDWSGAPHRANLGPTKRGAMHKVNPSGTKVAIKMLRVKALPWAGHVYHTGEITALNKERAAARRARMETAE